MIARSCDGQNDVWAVCGCGDHFNFDYYVGHISTSAIHVIDSHLSDIPDTTVFRLLVFTTSEWYEA